MNTKPVVTIEIRKVKCGHLQDGGLGNNKEKNGSKVEEGQIFREGEGGKYRIRWEEGKGK